MRKFVIKILSFFVIIVIIDIFVGKLGYYLQTHSKGGETKAINDLLMKDTHDVIILGSSRACHHYDSPFLSDTLGLDVYNAGYDGNGCILAYGILDLILERYHPKLVLFDVSKNFDIIVYDDNHYKRYISRLKPYYQNVIIGKLIKDVSLIEWYKIHSGLFRYNSKILNLFVDFVSNNKKSNSGYKPAYGELNTLSNNKLAENEVAIDSFKLKYTEKLIKLAQTYDVKIAFFVSPLYRGENPNVYKPIIDICNNHNVPLFNYYADPYFMNHSELFKDKGHLNANGARKYSSIVVKDILLLLNEDVLDK